MMVWLTTRVLTYPPLNPRHPRFKFSGFAPIHVINGQGLCYGFS